MRTDCSINGCQEMDAGVPFCHYYSIHQHALVLEVVQNIRLDGGKHNSLCVLPHSLPRTVSTQEDSVNVSTGYIVRIHEKDK